MEQNLPTPHPDLPGCYGNGNLGSIERFGVQKRFEHLEKRGNLTTTLFHAGLRTIIERNLFPEHFNIIDEHTGLSRRVLLASGMQNISAGNLAVVPSNRIGVNLGRDFPFAMGGVPEDDSEAERSPDGLVFMDFRVQTGKRVATGKFLGVIVNSSVPLLDRLKPTYEQDGTIAFDLDKQKDLDAFFQAAGEAAEAVIAAEKNFRNYTESGVDQELLTPEQIEVALDWVVLGDRK